MKRVSNSTKGRRRRYFRQPTFCLLLLATLALAQPAQASFVSALAARVPVDHVQAPQAVTEANPSAEVSLEEWLAEVRSNTPAKPVTLEGELLETHLHNGERVWVLRKDGLVFQAYMPVAGADVPRTLTLPGSRIAVTGHIHIYSDHSPEPPSFDVQMSSAGDIQLLQRPSAWSSRLTVAIVILLIALVLLVGILDIVHTRNVSEKTRLIRESEQKFRDLAEIDVLTGLPNRLTLEEKIDRCLSSCSREGQRAAILTIDIDRFKQINDTYGHHVGDECLKAVSTRLKSKIRHGDIIARTGGEEFTLVIGDLSSHESARKVCSSLLNLFQEPLLLADRGLPLTISIGAAIFPDDGTDSVKLRKRSDHALYEAKRTGRNRVVFTSEELSESSELATLVESKLRDDLRSNRFLLYFQPICDAERTVCRFEALLRSPNMHLARIGPGSFIPIAEECGLIVPLGQWVMRAVCRQIAEWRASGLKVCPVAVNVSGRQLARREFVTEVLSDMSRYNIQPELVEIELTETAVMSKLGTAGDVMSELASAGFTFAIDDFGTGYSSLSRLNQLPIKALKIDASFVRQLEMEGGSYTIVRAVIQMAKSLDLHVIAEGIETEEQFEILRGLGCDFFQGYLIGKPVPAEEAIERLGGNEVVLQENRRNPHWSSHLVSRSFS